MESGGERPVLVRRQEPWVTAHVRCYARSRLPGHLGVSRYCFAASVLPDSNRSRMF